MTVAPPSKPLPDLTLPALARAYATGTLTPTQVAAAIGERLHAGDAAWIAHPSPAELMERAQAIEARWPLHGAAPRPPLYGVPFAVKDNIDVAGVETTAACPAFAHRPSASAAVVDDLEAAGALFVGKTNLDQFATGLVGTRSPYGAVPNAFDNRYISGGSSSGSASVVARGLVSFALGTDTAGSGRVPAGFNNIVGLKPTRGRISTRGVLPACRSIDCVSILALTVSDAFDVLAVAGRFDPDDPFARKARTPRRSEVRAVGIPLAPDFAGDESAAQAFADAVSQVRELGVVVEALDFTPLHEAAALLYGGPWVAERLAVVEPLLRTRPDALDPSVRQVIERGAAFTAVDTFAALYRLRTLKRAFDAMLARVDALFVPTTPTIYTLDEIAQDPIGRNATLGRYTNFVNLLDGCALALPGGFRDDGLPAGVTVIGPAWSEAMLCRFGARWQASLQLPLGATGRRDAFVAPIADSPLDTDTVELAVVGAHLSGLPLNGELVERGATLVRTTRTSSAYRLYALAGTTPPKPGLVRQDDGQGAAIDVEVWRMPASRFGDFVAAVPPPMCIGTIELADGGLVKGFLCEPCALAGAREITSYGGWRAYIGSERSPKARLAVRRSA